MLTESLIVFPVVMAAVIAVGAISKLRSREESASAFNQLRLHPLLRSKLVVRGLPWLELVLALLLILLPRPASIIAAGGALTLMAIYTIVVARALTFDAPVICACFGKLGMGLITWRTVTRNLLLVGVAAGGLVWSIQSPTGVTDAVLNAPARVWGWLLVVALVALITALIVGGRDLAPLQQVGSDPNEEYLPVPIPMAYLETPEGSRVTLRELAQQRARLLLFIDPTCSACDAVERELITRESRLAPVSVERVTQRHQEDLADVLVDPGGSVMRLLEVNTIPGAVLLGTDGLLAGGPVTGFLQVRDFIHNMASELENVD